VLGRLLPSQARYHPFVLYPSRRRLWLPVDFDEERERALVWLLFLEKPVKQLLNNVEQTLWNSVMEHVERGDVPERPLLEWLQLQETKIPLPLLLDPLSLFRLWNESLSEPPEELRDIVVQELELIGVEHKDPELSDRDSRKFVLRHKESCRAHYAEQPSSIPLLGSPVLGGTCEGNHAFDLLHLLEDQFRHGVELRLERGSDEGVEQLVLDSFGALEDYLDGGSRELFFEAEKAWTEWALQTPLTEYFPGSAETVVLARSGQLNWVCPLCGEENLPVQSRCGRCFLGIISNSRNQAATASGWRQQRNRS